MTFFNPLREELKILRAELARSRNTLLKLMIEAEHSRAMAQTSSDEILARIDRPDESQSPS